ncbi:MAG: carbohydrate-binding domain-containing protein, partial [Lachnospiraceae bacterium]|nr:carbohydrate-binding domain-containing protein [Lachnospiraceae bacterium]
MKRSLKILFCLSILAFVIGIGNISAKAEEKYNVWIGSTQITSSNKDHIDGNGGGYATYDPVTKTLTCYNFSEVYGCTPSDALIEASEELTILGNLDLGEVGPSYGIYTGKTLQIDANIDVAGNTAIYSGWSTYINGGTVNASGVDHGIMAGDGSIFFKGGWTVASGHYDAVSFYGYGTDVYFENGMNAYYEEDNGDYELTEVNKGASGGFLTAQGAVAQRVIVAGAVPEEYDVWIGSTRVRSDNKDRIEGRDGGYASYDPVSKTLRFHDFKEVKDTGEYLVYSEDDLIITGTAYFGRDEISDYGIYCNGELLVSGNLSIRADQCALYGYNGIHIYGKDTKIYVNCTLYSAKCIYSPANYVKIYDAMVSCFTIMDNSHGIVAAKDIDILRADVTVNIFHGGPGCGMSGKEFDITDSKVSINSTDDGIRTTSTVHIINSDVAIATDYGNAISAEKGLYLGNNLTIVIPKNGKIAKIDGVYTVTADGSTGADKVNINKSSNTITEYPVFVGDIQVTSDNKKHIPGMLGGYASYDPDTKTLTCHVLIGVQGYVSTAIAAIDDLNIEGNASLDGKYSACNIGIYSSGKLSISGNISIKGMTAISAKNGVVISGKDTVVNAICDGVWSGGHCISSEGTVEVKSGKLICFSDMGEAIGIKTAGLTVSGGTVEISTEEYKGIVCSGKIDIKGGKLSVNAFEGIYTDEINITGGEVIVKGGVSAIEAKSKFTMSSNLAIFEPMGGRIRGVYGVYQIVDDEGDTAFDVHIAKNPITITMNPSDTTVEEGQLAYFEVKATGTKLEYLWQYKEKDMTYWEDWESKKTAKISVAYAKSRNGMKVRCVITDASGVTVTSGEAVLTYTAAGTSSFSITDQPKDASVPENELAYFGIKVKGEGLTYLWQYKEKGKTTWTDWTSKKTANISVAYAKSRNGMSLRCKVTDKNGKELISNVATLTYTSASGPSITEQPKNTSVKAGELAYFSITAKGDGLTYLWQYKEKGKSTWTDWTSKKTASISVAYQASRNGMSLRCVVTDKNGKKVTSNEAVLTYTSASTFAITQHPQNATAAENGLAYFSIKATGDGLKYLWQYKEKGKSTWTDWTTKTTPEISVAYAKSRDGMSLRCVVTDKNGSKLTSNEAVLTYTKALKITTQPVSSTVNKNTIAYFSVKAEGKGLKYLWQYKLAGDSSWTDWNSKTTADISVAYAAYRNNMQL